MTTQTFTKIIVVSALMCTGSVFAEEAVTAIPTEKAAETQKIIAAPVTSEEAIAELEESRRKVMEMKEPRDKHMAEAGAIAKKIEARRKAILEENKDAAKLSADIAEFEKVLEEKTLALNSVFDADKELVDLKVKMQEERVSFGKNQLKLREEISRQHRERRLAIEKAAQQKEAAAKEDEAATKATETAQENENK